MSAAVDILLLLATLGLAGAVVYLYRKLKEAHRQLHSLRQVDQNIEHALARLNRWTCSGRAMDRRSQGNTPPECRSQHGEELFAWSLLGEPMTGYYVDIGAYDGLRLSNTAFFEDLGWSGVLVEAHPELAAQCMVNRPRSRVVHAAVGDGSAGSTVEFSMVRGPQGVDTLSFVAASSGDLARVRREGGHVENVKVRAATVAQILDEQSPPRIDLMSIDVEGLEIEVLRGAALDRYAPRAIIIEDNSGGRDRRVFELLAQHGYKKVGRVGCNDFYLHASGSHPTSAT
jgi:FkbM family methyltransferase